MDCDMCTGYMHFLEDILTVIEMCVSGPWEAVRHGGGRRTKNLQGEGEKEEKGGKTEKRGERKERRKGKERERRVREKDVLRLLKHPLRTVKRL